MSTGDALYLIVFSTPNILTFQHPYYNSISVPDFTEQGCADDIDLYAWNHKICHQSRQTDGDYVEFRHPNATEMNIEWFQNKKILFIGDSHMEGLVTLFAERMCGYNPIVLKKKTEEPISSVHIDVSSDFKNIITENADFYEVEFSKKDLMDWRAKIDECRLESDNIKDCKWYQVE